MFRPRASSFAIVVLAFPLALAACRYESATPPPTPVVEAPPVDPAALAVLTDGLGTYEFPISTRVPLAQKFFNQGLMLGYGFNHMGAEQSFREAARLDPDCAICWWGVAWVLGPNINAPMEPAAAQPAWEALQKAIVLAPKASERERAYIRALSARYGETPPDDRTPLDEAYATELGKLAAQHPDDPDASTLHAEAMMNLHPWDFWEHDGSPKPWTGEILRSIESILATHPRHPGANHLYIHAVEASSEPGRALESAKLLASLAPGSGHLVHMPAHIYIRTGRYHEASLTNEAAIEADVRYLDSCIGDRDTLYEVAYMPHNWHFLWATTTLEGRSRRALEAAKRMSQTVNPQMMREPGYEGLQHYWVTPMFAEIRLGKWEDILARAEPDKDLVYPRGVWHYSRGMALASTNRVEEAKDELAALKTLAEDPAIADFWIWGLNRLSAILAIASNVLDGEIARREGRPGDAIAPLTRAVEQQDALRYDEPPPFHFQVRHLLGVALLDAGKPAEAEAVFREDLRVFPENGYSLLGLRQSLDAQGKGDEAAEVNARFDTAWKRADFEIGSAWL